MGFLDFIFLKRCVVCKKQGAYLCDKCFSYLSFDAKSLCLACNRPSVNGLTHPGCLEKYTINGCFSSLSYNKTTQRLIYNFKNKPFLTDLREVLSDLFYEGLIQSEGFNSELQKSRNWVLVPIPLCSLKLKKRGYNQSEILAKELGKRFNLKTHNLLKRAHDAKTDLKVEERRKNIRGAFAPDLKSMTDLKNIFLIDDIVATGFTLLECANVLKKIGAKRIIGLTLARN